MRCATCKHWLTDINKTEAEKADMECFKAIGYYICEIIDTPEWLQGISRQILSVSGCIGEQLHRRAASQMEMLYGRMGQRRRTGISGKAAA